MNLQNYEREFEMMICSGCPLSNGVNHIMHIGRVPCSVFPGKIEKLEEPHLCAMLSKGIYDQQELEDAIAQKGGTNALELFNDKLRELTAPIIEGKGQA